MTKHEMGYLGATSVAQAGILGVSLAAEYQDGWGAFGIAFILNPLANLAFFLFAFSAFLTLRYASQVKIRWVWGAVGSMCMPMVGIAINIVCVLSMDSHSC